MGNKKQKESPQQSQKTSKTPPDLESNSSSGGNIISSDLPSLYASVKIELSPAIKAMMRGEYTEALSLTNNLFLKYENSPQSAYVYHIQGAIYANVASVSDEPNAKLKHLVNAVESARRAVRLSPSSVQFTRFYAMLLYDMAKKEEDYEKVVRECERVLAIENAIDPAEEGLSEAYKQIFTTACFQNELRRIIRISNIKSISTWMKNLGDGEKFQVVPIRMNPEVPQEAKLVQERRPNGNKNPTKTPEERRKEIEFKVAVARLLQHNSEPLNSVDDANSNNNGKLIAGLGSVQKPGERRKSGNVKKNTSSGNRMDCVRSYWNSMSSDWKKDFLRVKISDLKTHFNSSEDRRSSEVLNEALSVGEANKMWMVWICCLCNQKLANACSLVNHVHEHMESQFPIKMSIVPQKVKNEWNEMILKCIWKPLELNDAVLMLLEKLGSGPSGVPDLVDHSYNRHNADDSKEWFLDIFCHEYERNSGDVCNCSTLNGREFEDVEWKNSDAVQSPVGSLVNENWPLSNDPVRAKLLVAIRTDLEALIKHKYLASSHLSRVIQYAVETLQGLECGPQLLHSNVVQTPLCICLLGAQELKKIREYLEEISQACELSKCFSESNATVHSKSELQRVDIIEKVKFSEDCSFLVLDEHFLPCKIPRSSCNEAVSCDFGAATSSHIIYENGVVLDSDALLSWIFSGPPFAEQLPNWTHLRESITQLSQATIGLLTKKIEHLQMLCEKKSRHISNEEELQKVKTLCLEGRKKMEDETDIGHRSNEYVLVERRQELTEKGNQIDPSVRLELNVITNVLKDVQSLLDKQLAVKGTYNADNNDDYPHEVDSCIEVAIQRQKEQVSIEMGKVDAIIMQTLREIQLQYVKLQSASSHDFLPILVLLMKFFLLARLECLAEKDATEKSDAAREAILAELALDSGRGVDAGVHHSKHVNEKRKKKNKNKNNHKNKDLKASNIDESVKDILLLGPASENSVAGSDHGALQLQEEEQKRRTEFEAEERKLVEVSENQIQSENLGKEKHSTEQWTDTLDGGWMTAKHPRRGGRNRYIGSENEDSDTGWPKVGMKSPGDDYNGAKTLTPSQDGLKKAESQGPGTFQEPKEPPFISSSLRPLVVLTEISDSSVSCDGVKTNVTKVNSCGRGLKNVFGQYNCYLNVIIQSLWHLQRFRDEFFLWGSSKHEHVCDQCPACALFDIFNALSVSPSDNRREAVDPSSLLVALGNKYPDTKFFQKGQMNDASEILGLILDCLHQLFTPAPVTESVDAKCNCLSHSIFGLDIIEEMNCSYCLLVSTYDKTSYFHYITASSLRIKKVEFPEKSFVELLYLVQREDKQVCDAQKFGCGKPNYMSFVLSTAPHVFTAVLSWKNERESVEDIKATLAALSTDIDIGALCNGLHPQKRHCLVSVVCFIGLHYKCFAYSHEQWIICDDETVKVIGRWSDVLKMCEEQRLQPTILFFEAVNK